MKRCIAAALLAGPMMASAASGTFSESGVLSTAPGYGYLMEGSFQSTVGDFTFSKTTRDQGDGEGYAADLFAGIALKPKDTYSLAENGSLHVTLKVSFIDLATGEPALPVHLFSPSLHIVDILGNASGGTAVATLSKPELRFSNPKFEQSGSVSTQSLVSNGANFMIGYACDLIGSSCLGHPYATRFVSLDYAASFMAGHFLAASNDPTCASLSCMEPGHDSLVLGTFSVGLNVTTVPEPSSYLLFAFGLAGMLSFSRRQRT